jgi:ABC-type glycerol-3-phosphate transport system permease component
MASRQPAQGPTRIEPRKQRAKWHLSALMLVIVLIVNLPIILMVLNSFRSTEEILSSDSIFPQRPSLANFEYLSQRTAFWTYFGNSIAIAVGGTAVTIVLAGLAGYALSRFRARAITVYSRGLLMVQMFPLILMLIPLFILFRELGLINTRTSVILLYSVVHLPFATWMFKAFFDSIPRDLEEAAQVDGATKFGSFWRIVLRLSGPGIAAVTIFSFLFSYNEYLIANIFLRDESKMTIPVGVQMFMQQFGSDWGNLMAASTLAMLPTVIFFLFVQKYMVYGAVAGAVKG